MSLCSLSVAHAAGVRQDTKARTGYSLCGVAGMERRLLCCRGRHRGDAAARKEALDAWHKGTGVDAGQRCLSG
jgi:hypothetical protein